MLEGCLENFKLRLEGDSIRVSKDRQQEVISDLVNPQGDPWLGSWTQLGNGAWVFNTGGPLERLSDGLDSPALRLFSKIGCLVEPS